MSPCHTPIPPSTPCPPHPSGSSQSTGFGCFMHWSSVLHVVIYTFQHYSLKSSHPRLLPLSPNVCSLHLCFLCRPACRIVVTIFLFCEWCKGVIWLFSNGKLISPALLIDKNTRSPPRGHSTMNPLLTFYAICVSLLEFRIKMNLNGSYKIKLCLWKFNLIWYTQLHIKTTWIITRNSLWRALT